MVTQPTDIKPSDVGLQSFRPNQLETILEAIMCPEKVVMIDGPPGCGKSAIAAGIAWYYGQQEYFDSKSGRNLPITSLVSIRTHNLQDQYVSDFPWMERLYGRSNYGCAIGERNAAEGICTVSKSLCDLAGTDGCEYYAAVNRATASKTLVINNDLLVLGRKFGTQPIRNRKVLLVDEAHLLDESIRSANGVELTHTNIWRHSNQAGVPIPTGTDPQTWLEWSDFIREQNRELLDEYNDAINNKDHERIRALRPHVRGIQTIIELGQLCKSHNSNPSNPVVIRDAGQVVKVEPIWANRYFPSFLKSYDKIIMLSATLPGPEMMAQLLGLKESDYRIIQIPSTFPAANRPWIVEPVVSVKKGMSDESLDRLVDRIDYYLGQYPDSKGIIHCHAYWLRDAITARSRFQSRFITHGSRGIREAVERYKRTNQAVLISPTAHTGVDLPYDQCRFQLILKLPAPDLGDPVIDARRKEMPITYDLMIAATLLQTYGRIMRAADDSGTTISLDSNFRWWLRRNWNLIPAHVQEAIQFVPSPA